MPLFAQTICNNVAVLLVQIVLQFKAESKSFHKKKKGNKKMQIKIINQQTAFMKINAAAKVTGLSQYYLRKGCKDGSVPHVMSGTVYNVNVPALLRKLNADGSAEG